MYGIQTKNKAMGKIRSVSSKWSLIFDIDPRIYQQAGTGFFRIYLATAVIDRSHSATHGSATDPPQAMPAVWFLEET